MKFDVTKLKWTREPIIIFEMIMHQCCRWKQTKHIFRSL